MRPWRTRRRGKLLQPRLQGFYLDWAPFGRVQNGLATLGVILICLNVKAVHLGSLLFHTNSPPDCASEQQSADAARSLVVRCSLLPRPADVKYARTATSSRVAGSAPPRFPHTRSRSSAWIKLLIGVGRLGCRDRLRRSTLELQCDAETMAQDVRKRIHRR